MLVLSRKQSQRIRLGDSIVITVVRVAGDKVRLGIEAPRDMLVLRDELEPHELGGGPGEGRSPLAASARIPTGRSSTRCRRRARSGPRARRSRCSSSSPSRSRRQPLRPTPQPCRRRAARRRPRRPRRCRPPDCSRDGASRSTNRRPGTVVRTVPAAGEEAPDGRVRVVVSAGFPRIAYEGGAPTRDRRRCAGPRRHGVLPREIVGTKPSWTPDGRAVVAADRHRRLGDREHEQPGPAHGARPEPCRRQPRRAVGRRGPDGPVLAFVSHDPELGDRVCFSRPCPEPTRAGRRASASTAGGSASSRGCRTAARCSPRRGRPTARTGVSAAPRLKPTRASPPAPATGAAAAR